jgi:RNA polymerase sigma-70 factor (ECF subfamily)
LKIKRRLVFLDFSRKKACLAVVYIFVEPFGMVTRRRELIPTRESLLSRLKNREDRDSWEDFFETYWQLIYSTARKAGLTDAEAQDIVQETVISVARNIEGFKYDPAVCSFKSWMLQLTRWRIINQLKKRQKPGRSDYPPASGAPDNLWIPATDRTDRTPIIERIPDPAGLDLEIIWNEEWEKHLLTAAMERVKRKVAPEQLQLFDLYCVESWPAQKVAQMLGVSLGRVYLAKHRIGQLLKKEIRSLRQTLE